MKPRHRAKIRLARTSPGDRTRPVRPLVERIEVRKDRGDPPIQLPIPWKQLLYERRPVPLARHKLAQPTPNAPLLKRVVRHPYALEPKGTRRVQLIDVELAEARQRQAPSREPVRLVFAEGREMRERPVLELPERLDRPHPFGRQRRAAEEQKWEHILGEAACTTT